MGRTAVSLSLGMLKASIQLNKIHDRSPENALLGCVKIKFSKSYRPGWHKRYARLVDGRICFYKYRAEVIWEMLPRESVCVKNIHEISFHNEKKKVSRKNWSNVQLNFRYDGNKRIYIRFPNSATVNLWMTVFTGGKRKVRSMKTSRQGRSDEPSHMLPTNQLEGTLNENKPVEMSSSSSVTCDRSTDVGGQQSNVEWDGTTERTDVFDAGKVDELITFQAAEGKFLDEKLRQAAIMQRTGSARGSLHAHESLRTSIDVPKSLVNTMITEVTICGCNEARTARTSLEHDLATLSLSESRITDQVGGTGEIINEDSSIQGGQSTWESQRTLTTPYEGMRIEREKNDKSFVEDDNTTSRSENYTSCTVDEQEMCDCRPRHKEPCAIAHPPFAKIRDRIQALLFQQGGYTSPPALAHKQKNTAIQKAGVILKR
uniref:PH domain-containing protein n=1 Tax=Trichuris muris TaxID=70415 RepID=A0A5S6QGM3_TRIMR